MSSTITTLLTTANGLLNTHSTRREGSIAAALEAATQALRLAEAQERPDLAARAELLRGHALRAMGRWTLANGCYERAQACTSSVVVVMGGVVMERDGIVETLAPQAGIVSPLDLLTWTPSDLRKAQERVVEGLKEESRELKLRTTSNKEQEPRVAAIDAELSAWEGTLKVSTELEPSWEDFTEQRRRYEAHIADLEAEVERLRAGKAPTASPPPETVSRARDLEKRWLQKSPQFKATKEWKEEVGAILYDAVKLEEKLGSERRALSTYRADLDLEKAELAGYRNHVEGDVRSVFSTANELLAMISGVRKNLKKQKEDRDRGGKDGGSRVYMTPLDAMLAAECVFKPTHELAERVVMKVKTARENMAGFQEGDGKGESSRAPWELVRAIRSRDVKIEGLEGELGELRERVAELLRRMKQAQEASNTLLMTSNTSQNADRIKAITSQVEALRRLLSGLVPACDEHTSHPARPKDTAPNDEADLITSDEYGNIIKMAEKFDRMRSYLQAQIKRLENMTSSYKVSRDEARESARESRELCQRLQGEVESMRDEIQNKIQKAVRERETWHANELAECQEEASRLNEELIRRKDDLRRKASECEDLKVMVSSGEKKLLAYKMDSEGGENEMAPVVQIILERTEREQAALNHRNEELSRILSNMKTRNTSLEEALQEEEEMHDRYRDLTNTVPAMRRSLEDAKKAAEQSHSELEAARARIETLKHDVETEKHARFDIENGEAEARSLVTVLRSDLQDQKYEAEKRVANLQEKLDLEAERHKVKAAEYHRNYSEVLRNQEELARDVTAGISAEGKPAALLRSVLNQRSSLLEELRSLRDKHAVTISNSEYAVKQAKKIKEELSRLQQTETRLRDEHATALIELESAQGKLGDASAELQVLKDLMKKQEERRNDPEKVWEDTPIGMSKKVFEARICALEENLVKSLRAGSPLGLMDDAGDHEGPGIRDHSELINMVKKICGSWSPSDGPLDSALTKADMTIFAHQRDLQSKKLVLLRAIRDRNWARGYKAMETLDKFLQETDLGATTDESWGSVQYLNAYFHLYVANDVAAAQAATRRAREHGPEQWSRKFYRDMGSRLEAELQNRMAGGHRESDDNKG